jgi:hypothetical protein
MKFFVFSQVAHCLFSRPLAFLIGYLLKWLNLISICHG